jgi:hypothetical protein
MEMKIAVNETAMIASIGIAASAYSRTASVESIRPKTQRA